MVRVEYSDIVKIDELVVEEGNLIQKEDGSYEYVVINQEEWDIKKKEYIDNIKNDIKAENLQQYSHLFRKKIVSCLTKIVLHAEHCFPSVNPSSVQDAAFPGIVMIEHPASNTSC